MEQRGRKGSASLQVAHIPGNWPDAPECLTESQAESWRAIVATKPHDWFGPDTYPLLVEYVRAVEAADVVGKAMDEFDPEWLKDPDGLKRYDTLSKLQNAKASTLARLATKMRLSQQSRYEKSVAAVAARNASNTQKPWQKRGPAAS